MIQKRGNSKPVALYIIAGAEWLGVNINVAIDIPY